MWLTSTVAHFLTDISQGTSPKFSKGWCINVLKLHILNIDMITFPKYINMIIFPKYSILKPEIESDVMFMQVKERKKTKSD